MKRRRVGRGGLGQLADRPRPVLEPVGDAQGRGQLEGARHCALVTHHLADHTHGQRFGGRDHTTVLHACRRIESLCKADPVFQQEVDFLRKVLGRQQARS